MLGGCARPGSPQAGVALAVGPGEQALALLDQLHPRHAVAARVGDAVELDVTTDRARERGEWPARSAKPARRTR